MKIIATAFLLFAFFCRSFSQPADINISNSGFWDTEPYLICFPSDSSKLVCAWMSTGAGLITIKTKVSFDAGNTWGSTQLFSHHYTNATSADVSMQYDNDGELYLSFIDYKTTFDSGAVYLYKSTDYGMSWDNGTKVFDITETSDGAVDRPWFTIDRSQNATQHNIYLCTKSPEAVVASVKHLWLKRSTDGGATFTSPIQIDDTNYPAAGDKTMATPCVDANGNLYIVYLSYQTGTLQYPKLVCAKSTDAGNSFSYSIITQFTQVADSSLQIDWDVTACNTTPVVVYTLATATDVDIMSQRFDGTNWSVAQRLNTDAVGNGINQDMVWIKSQDPLNNIIAVAWRDRRNFAASLTAPFEIYVCVSDDGGATFYPDNKMSSGNSPFQMLVKGNDFLGVDLCSPYLFAAWGDYRDGNWEIYFNKVYYPQLMNTVSVNDQQPQIVFSNQTIQINNNRTFNTFELIDANGKLLLKKNLLMVSHENITIQNDLPAGIYMAQLSNRKKSFTKQFAIISSE